MRYTVVTLFPQIIESFCGQALLGKAQERELIRVACVDPREFTTDRHRTVDDAPYGGGGGMVMKPGPLVAAMEKADGLAQGAHRVLLTPQGSPLTQAKAAELAKKSALTLICGRYEGIDERARKRVDEEISVGDFVLMGGELGALIVIEATARLIGGVLGNPTSSTTESHSEGRLEYPHYTRPAEFRSEGIPDVLLGGHHAQVAAWRRKLSLRRTLERRPDLLDSHPPSDEERRWLAEWAEEDGEVK